MVDLGIRLLGVGVGWGEGGGWFEGAAEGADGGRNSSPRHKGVWGSAPEAFTLYASNPAKL